MLMRETILTVLASTLIASAFAYFGWLGLTVVNLEKNGAITTEKVVANHKMIKPMWEDFLRTKRMASHDKSGKDWAKAR